MVIMSRLLLWTVVVSTGQGWYYGDNVQAVTMDSSGFYWPRVVLW